MKLPSSSAVSLVVCLVVSSLTGTGCTSTDDTDLLDPSKSGLEGKWTYVALNGHSATYTGCTGDATILEGVSFADAFAVVPICTVSGEFDVVQAGESFTVVAHTVTCSDGSTGSAAGEGVFSADSLSGGWETGSDGGVNASQSFTGTAVGELLEIFESERTFSGSLQGSCGISPPLNAVITVG